jgi:arabinogalactan oligomer/maltooligosaccharide transport system substrate-binding protein
MALNRRQLIGGIGSATVGGVLAGCIGVSEQTDTAASTDDGGDGGDSTATDTGTPRPPRGTATAWYSLTEDEKVAMEENVATFNEASRGTVEGTDLSDLQQKLTSAVPAGEGPQTFDWAHDLAGDYASQGFLAPQTDQVSVSLDQFTEAARDAAQYDGDVIGLPHAAETVGLVYNTDMVEAAPSTVAEMQSVMDEHHDPDNGSYGLSYPLNPYFYSAWAQAFGGYYFDAAEDRQLGLTREETVRGFEFVLDELVPYMPNDPAYGAQVAPFLDGNAPFAINGPWFLPSAAENDVSVNVSPLPSIDGAGDPRPYTGISLWYFASGMEADEAKANTARAWAEWYTTNEDLLLEAAETSGAIPVLQSLSGTDDLPEKVKGFSQAVEQGYPMPAEPKMNKVWDPVGDAFMKAYNGSATVSEAMSSAESTIRSNWE